MQILNFQIFLRCIILLNVNFDFIVFIVLKGFYNMIYTIFSHCNVKMKNCFNSSHGEYFMKRIFKVNYVYINNIPECL